MPAHAGGVTGARPEAFVDEFSARPLRSPPRSGPLLTRWQAFGTLWRQQWDPAPRDERGLRIFGMSASLVIHVGLAVVLAWLMYLHMLVLLQVPEPAPGEGHVVQVEYVGTGTPDTPGGGEVPTELEIEVAAPQRTAAATPAPTPSQVTDEAVQATAPEPARPELPVDVSTPTIAATVPPVTEREIPVPTPPQAAQPLQVTEVEQPDIDFVLPPPTVRVDALAQRELAVPTRDVPEPEVIEEIEADLPTGLPSVAVDAPDAAMPVLALPEREVPAPTVATRVPAPVGPPADANATAVASPDARAAGTERSEQVAQGRDATGQDADAGAAVAADGDGAPTRQGAGPETVAAPGGWPSPTRGDDWDDALRDRAGGRAGEAGLLDGTGRPNLAGTGGGGPPGSAPPGSQAREAIDLERGGTWLRRPPLDHRPTRFDRIWIPTGTLLEEWVRRGIKQMSIPIPGTSKEIVCVVSILQLGGGCGISDPNLKDRPSSGQAAPDVPFKPELQEDQDSLAKPPGG